MWIFNHPLLEIVLRAAIIYIVVLIGIRLTGKREVRQMTPFDLVLLLLIANALQNAMTKNCIKPCVSTPSPASVR